VHFKTAILSLSASLHVLMAKSMSSFEAIPVEIITGLFLLATYSINGISVISKDAILYAPISISSKKSTEVSSKGEENTINPKSSATFFSLGCQSHGINASS